MNNKNKYLSKSNGNLTVGDRSICNYFCYDEVNDIHYIAINSYRDLVGDNYAKPIYIEDTPLTSQYLQDCKKTNFRQISFISLIKNNENRYRLNKDIYSDSKHILGLRSDEEPSFTYDLLKIPTRHIVEIISPSEAFKRAEEKNPLVKELLRVGPKEFFDYGVEIGLIGSVSFDASIQAKDLDLVFSGDPLKIKNIYNWFSTNKDTKLAPLQKRTPFLPVLLCSFFSIQNQYPKDVTSLHIKTRNKTRKKIKIIRNINPPFLNLQCYEILNLQTNAILELWVRDTLGRCVLAPNDQVTIDAYPSECQGRDVFFLTDVEQQLYGKNVHFL